jgi:hypothetical protein
LRFVSDSHEFNYAFEGSDPILWHLYGIDRSACRLGGRRFLPSQHFRRDKDDATGRSCRNRFVQHLQQQGNALAEGEQHVGSAIARRLADLCHCRVRDVEDGAATLAKNNQAHFGFFGERPRDVLKLYFGLHDWWRRATGFGQTSENGGRDYNERAGRFIQKIYEDCECKKIELRESASHPNSVLDGVNKKDDVGLRKIRGPRSIPTLSILKHETVPKTGEKFVGAYDIERWRVSPCRSLPFTSSGVAKSDI